MIKKDLVTLALLLSPSLFAAGHNLSLNESNQYYHVQKTALYNNWYTALDDSEQEKVSQMVGDAVTTPGGITQCKSLNSKKCKLPKDDKRVKKEKLSKNDRLTKKAKLSIWEMKVRTAVNGIRIYYCIVSQEGLSTLVLLNGGDKSSKSQQEKDIRDASALTKKLG